MTGGYNWGEDGYGLELQRLCGSTRYSKERMIERCFFFFLDGWRSMMIFRGSVAYE